MNDMNGSLYISSNQYYVLDIKDFILTPQYRSNNSYLFLLESTFVIRAALLRHARFLFERLPTR